MKLCKKLLFVTFLTISSSIAAENSASKSANFLEQSSEAFTQIADKAMPATVSIKAIITPQNSNQGQGLDFSQDEFFKRFFGPNFSFPQAEPQPQTSGGSGFIISNDGFIVTNYHVIKDASEITVILNDERQVKAEIKGTDPRTDLALLKIEEKNLPFLTFGDSDRLRVGEWVAATGNPFGLEATLTVGVVSAKGRQDLGVATYEDFIQTDAAINPGNSGGPLLNLKAEVVGVNTAILSRSGGYMGIGLSIPSKMAQAVIDQLKNTGSVQRAYLGVMLQPIDKEMADALGLEKQEGILIAEVLKDSPAYKAGLQNGDIILQYNSTPVKNNSKFRNEIALLAPGTKIDLKILRNGKQQNVAVVLGNQKESEKVSTETLEKIGIQVENLTPDLAARLGYSADTGGVVITKVKPNSAAALAGIRPYHIITGAVTGQNNQKKISNTTDLEEALKETGDKKHIVLVIRDQNFQRYYTIKIK